MRMKPSFKLNLRAQPVSFSQPYPSIWKHWKSSRQRNLKLRERRSKRARLLWMSSKRAAWLTGKVWMWAISTRAAQIYKPFLSSRRTSIRLNFPNVLPSKDQCLLSYSLPLHQGQWVHRGSSQGNKRFPTSTEVHSWSRSNWVKGIPGLNWLRASSRSTRSHR